MYLGSIIYLVFTFWIVVILYAKVFSFYLVLFILIILFHSIESFIVFILFCLWFLLFCFFIFVLALYIVVFLTCIRTIFLSESEFIL